MKKAIFFDFGDVLAFCDHMKGCGALAPYSTKSAGEIYELIFRSKLEDKHYNRGEYTDQEWYKFCVELLGLRGCSYKLFAELWGAIFSPNQKIDKVMKLIGNGTHKFVLSNTNGLHWRWIQKNLSVLNTYFPHAHQAILSYEEKTKKPERLIYERALARAAVQASETIFIDDKQENVRAFEALGGDGIIYSAHSQDTEHLECELKRYFGDKLSL